MSAIVSADVGSVYVQTPVVMVHELAGMLIVVGAVEPLAEPTESVQFPAHVTVAFPNGPEQGVGPNVVAMVMETTDAEFVLGTEPLKVAVLQLTFPPTIENFTTPVVKVNADPAGVTVTAEAVAAVTAAQIAATAVSSAMRLKVLMERSLGW